MTRPTPCPSGRRHLFASTPARVAVFVFASVVAGFAGLLSGRAEHVRALPSSAPGSAPAAAPGAAPVRQVPPLTTLRLHGLTTVCNECIEGEGNGPATGGTKTAVGSVTGLIPEDPPYTDPRGPFDPLSDQAPEGDVVTWNPAWISERLGAFVDDWPGLTGIDEVSAASNIRIGGINGSEKVWLRHWYEPTHLDKDLNADDCLTDNDNDGIPDARMNPHDRGADEDEWYPAIMVELTYMLLDNEQLDVDLDPGSLDDSAPRPACGPAGRTSFIFPVGVEAPQLDPSGPLEGYGLTSLDYDFDGTIDQVELQSEAGLAAAIGVDIDFDGDGVLESIDPDGIPLSCDELIVLHTDPVSLGEGDRLQFLDHYVTIASVSNNSAVVQVWYSGDLRPRLVDARSIGVGAVGIAGDVGPLQVVPAGGSTVGTVPRGAWFVTVQAVDAIDDTATVMVGRALGAPCASMESAPNRPNLSPGEPWFLKRFYVDGHEYNIVALMSCDTDSLQYITMRSPLPKVPVTIEQHSVRLQPYDTFDSLVLPPPFNHEHTILEDIVAFEEFDEVDPEFPDTLPRPEIRYMGGPIGPIPPVLSDADPIIYTGRDPARPVGPYDELEDFLATRWFYVDEAIEPGFVGQLRERYGAGNPQVTGPGAFEGGFFYNEQIYTAPRNYTEFYMPNQRDPAPDPITGVQPYDPDNYHVLTAFENDTSRWRRWTMPDGGVPDNVPPIPPDLTEDHSEYDPITMQYGAPRRAEFHFDPDNPEHVSTGGDGAHLHGGFPLPDDAVCLDALSRPAVLFGGGDPAAATDTDGFPVEVLPYTDPFAPFNPQHPHAPAADTLTFNPVYMDEFRHFGEDLRLLTRQISNSAQNARQKVYQRVWYEPDYVTKIIDPLDCEDDLSFLAVVQEFTYLYMDTTDNPVAVPPGASRFAFPIGTRADELPLPNAGGSLPMTGHFGYGLTTFDADFDGFPEPVSIHTEATIADHFDTQWQANRPVVPGFPLPPIPGPVLDFDGDGVLDDLDEDCIPLNGNEMVVFAVESIVLDTDDMSSDSPAAMFLDHMVRLENVTAGGQAQFRVYFTGGNPIDARPESVGGITSLGVGEAAIVDRFQDSVTIVEPGQTNVGTDGAWFIFVEDVAPSQERVTVTIGRALGATHSAIDNGAGFHDLSPGDPWYLKRFYVDGHEYNVVALMTQTPAGADPNDPGVCNSDFAWITIRTPVPKGNFFNPQDSLFQQGYFLDGLPAEISVMPPYNMEHTIAVDVERIDADDFAFEAGYDACVGQLAPADPMVERILAEAPDPRFGTELRETYHGRDGVDGTPPDYRDPDPLRDRDGWQTHQVLTTPNNVTQLQVPEGQNYLLTLNWRTHAGRLAFYGCTRGAPGPFSETMTPELDHPDLTAIADGWAEPFGIIPAPTIFDPPQTRPRLRNGDDAIVPYYDAQCTISDTVRVKIFFDPSEDDDIYVNERDIDLPFDIADAEIEKTAGVSDPVAGDELTYTITVTNHGPDDIATAIITDTLPMSVTYVSDTDACIQLMPGDLRCSLGPLAAGASDSFALTVRLDPSLATDIALLNLTGVTLPGAFDDDPSNNFDDELVIVRRESDLRIEKTASTLIPRAGTQFVYTLTAFNDGPSDATAVTVTDTLPSGVTYVSDTGGGVCINWGGPLVECFFDDLPAGDSASVSVTVMVDPAVPPGTRLTNGARIRGGSPDPDPTNNEAEVDVFVTAFADLALSKTAEPNPVVAGELLTYTIRVTNTGPSAAASVFVSDPLPPETTYQGVIGAFCGGVPIGGTGTLTCSLGSLGVGASASFQIIVRVDPSTPPGTTLQNSATASAPGTTDEDLSDNTDQTDTDVIAEADLQISKSAPDPVFPGQIFTWTVFVTNTGASDAVAVEVVDTIPAGTTYQGSVGATCAGVAIGGTGNLTCALGDMAAGDSTSFGIRLRVDPGMADGAPIFNSAVVDSDTPDPDGADNTTVDDTSVRRQADLSITKTGPATAFAGGTFNFSMSVNNAGPSLAENVVVTDTLPAGMSFVSSTGGCVEAPPASGLLSCAIGNIPASGSAAFSITVSVDPSVADGTVLTNLAGASSGTVDPDSSDNTDDADVTILRRADLSITKSDEPDPVIAGELLTYTLEVTNAGPSDASNVEVVDTLPAGVSHVSDSHACVEAPAGTLTCSVGSLAGGTSDIITIVVQVDADVPFGDVLVNSAEVDAVEVDPVPGNNSDTESTAVEALADLEISKIAADTSPVAGTQLTYTLSVTNTGPSRAPIVVVTDVLPIGTTFVSSSAACVVSGIQEITCFLSPLSPGASSSFTVTVSIDASVPDGTDLTNEAGVDGGVPDPDPSDNVTTETVVISASADLAIDKIAPAMAEPGEEFMYGIEVENLGPSDAVDVVVVDTLPSGVTFVGASGDVCVEGPAGTLTCALGDIAANDTYAFTITVLVDAGLIDGATLTNTASVDSGTDDPEGGNDQDSADTDVDRVDEADLSIEKEALNLTPAAGEAFTYMISVHNDGPRTAPNVVVVDTLPAGVSYIFDSDSCVQAPIGTLTCSLGDVMSGATVDFTITVFVDSDRTDGEILTNTAIVGSDLPDPDGSDNTDTADITVTRRADLTITKSASSDPVNAGSRVTYTLHITNAGPSPATNVVVTDTLPANTVYAGDSDACVQGPVGTLVCSPGDLAAGESTSFEIYVDVDPGAAGLSLINTAVVGGDEPDPDPGDNDTTEITDVDSSADIALQKTASHDERAPGEVLTYTLSVQNLGPSDASGVTVTDTLPADVTYLSDDAGCDTSGLPQIVCSLGNLAEGASADVVITVQVNLDAPTGSTLLNAAVAGSDEPDPDPGNDDDDVPVEVTPAADLSVTKSAEGEVTTLGAPPGTLLLADLVTAGRRLTYTLTVANAGPSTATGVTLTDTLPAGVSHVSDDAGCDTSDLPVIVCSLPDIPSGGSAEVVIVVDVSAAVAGGAILTNTAAVGAVEPDADPADNDAVNDTTVQAASDLSIDKSASPSVVTTGDLVTFTLSVQNLGPSNVPSVTVLDTLPISLTYVSDTDSCVEAPPATLTCSLGPLSAGATAAFDIVALVEAGLEGDVVTNTATVSAGAQLDPDPTNNSDSATFDVVGTADLTLTKDVIGARTTAGSPPGSELSPDFVTAGRHMTYTLSVQNQGPDPAPGTVVTDTLPAGVSIVSAPGCDTSGFPVIVCDMGTVPPLVIATRDIVVQVDASIADGTTLTNAAVVAAEPIDSNPGDNTAQVSIDVEASADLSIIKSVEPLLIDTGDLITFTILVANAGPSDAVSVEVVDLLPVGITYVSDTDSCVEQPPASGDLKCTLGPLAAGDMTSFQIVAQVESGLEGQTIQNTASVSLTGPGTDPDPSNDQDQVDFDVDAMAGLNLTKSGVANRVAPGSPPTVGQSLTEVTAGLEVTYTLSVSNFGPNTATNVVVTDTLPAGTIFKSSGIPCVEAPFGTLRCEVGALDINATSAFTVFVKFLESLPEGYVGQNVAVTTSDQPDPEPADNTASVEHLVRSHPDLDVVKSVDPAFPSEGDPVTYTVVVENHGPSDAADVTISDTLPAGVTYVSDTAGCDTSGLPLLVCGFGPIPSGSTIIFDIVAEVDPGTAGQVIENTAHILLTGDGLDPDPANNTSSASIEVAGTVDMRVTADAIPLTVDPGEAVTYATRVENVGAGTAHSVVLTDTLPGGITPGPAPAGCSFAGQVLTCSLGDFSPAQLSTIAYTGTVGMGLSPGTELVNAAEVASAGIEVTPADNSDSVTVTVGTGVFGFTVTLDAEGRADVDWIDEAVDESMFDIQFSAGGSRWVTAATVSSTTTPGTGAPYAWTSPPLVAGVRYAVRVVARDRDGRPIMTAAGTASPPEGSPTAVGCIDARVTLAGLSRHDGAILLLDGIPVRLSDLDGSVGFCGAAPGVRSIAAIADGHLEASAVIDVPLGGTLELPGASLPGGDVDGDGRVSILDLVRVGAAQGGPVRPGARFTADANRDGVIDLLDLVLVAGSYARVGPVPWHASLGEPAAARPDAFPPARLDGIDGATAAGDPALWDDVSDLLDAEDGPIVLHTRALQADRVAVDVTARGVRDLFGADVVFTYDPSVVRLIDADPAAGLQVTPGEVWSDQPTGFVAARQVEDEAVAWVRFAATRRAPAPSLRGDVVLFTAVFESVDPDEAPPARAWSVLSARLLTAGLLPIDAAIDGVDLRSPIDWTRLREDIFLPFVTR